VAKPLKRNSLWTLPARDQGPANHPAVPREVGLRIHTRTFFHNDNLAGPATNTQVVRSAVTCNLVVHNAGDVEPLQLTNVPCLLKGGKGKKKHKEHGNLLTISEP